MSWEVKPLEEVCNVEFGTRVVKKKDGGSIYPVFGGGGATFSMDEFNREDRLVVARFAMSEQCTRFVQGKFFLNDSGLTVSPRDSKKLALDFLNYHLLALNDEIYALGKGTAQRNLESDAFRRLHLSIPDSLPEQQRIVGKLDAAFTALAEAQAHVERNRANARELFESYLNGVFEGKGDGWVEKRLGDLIDIQNGYAFSSNEYKDEGHFLIRISNVQDGEITLANPKYVAIDDSRLKRFILNEGDILVSLTGNIGRVGIMQAEHLPAALNQRVARITLKDEKTIRHNFLFFFLRSNFFREHLQAAGHGAAQQNVSTKEIAEVELSLPPLAEQQRVLDALRELQIKTDDLETTYQQKLTKLAGLKKAVLGAAFRGEL